MTARGAKGSTRLSGPTLDKFLDGLRLGMTRRAASGAVGISKSTLYRMLQGDDDGTLLDSIEKAEAEAEALYLSRVALAADDPKNWTAAAWWLERRRSQDFARRDKVEMSIDLRTIAARIAEDSDLDPDAILAEAEAYIAGER